MIRKRYMMSHKLQQLDVIAKSPNPTHTFAVSLLDDIEMSLDRPELDALLEDDDVLVRDDHSLGRQGGEVRGGGGQGGDGREERDERGDGEDR